MYHYDKDHPEYGVRVYGVDEVKLLGKSRTIDGFSIEQDAEIDPSKKSFIDETRKIVIDNSAPYGHMTTTWLHMLLTELEELDAPVTILFYKSPDTRHMRLEHSSNLTEYLYDRFTQKGHVVKYIDAEEFYVNNFITFLTPINVSSANMDVVAEFFSEGLDYSQKPMQKIYLTRSKTTTYNGNHRVLISDEMGLTKEELDTLRTENKYQFSNRIDDEQALEEYLKTLGFIIYCPEDNESYRDQLQLFASSKIVMSLTSSALSVCSAMAPNTLIVELTSPMFTKVDSSGNLIEDYVTFHDIYKNISTLKSNLYLSISNRYRKAANIIESIEDNPGLKALLSS